MWMWIIGGDVAIAVIAIAVYHYGWGRSLQAIKDEIALIKSKLP